MDMCSHISTNSSDYVNLQLNPERYTGYNGSHVWEAIYKENCLVRTGGHDDSMCYEERVLYRLLSGMHAATNTHVARCYRASSNPSPGPSPGPSPSLTTNAGRPNRGSS